ncbi:MAG: Na+/H+ antiporter NhaC family protein [Bacteroidetes bacterium]|nr:Na+/H+ antiporter NhaC family protein [Bacteroidota bacterium]
MHRSVRLFFFIAMLAAFSAAHGGQLRLDVPALLLDGVSFRLEVTALDAEGRIDTTVNGALEFRGVSFPEGIKPVMRKGRFLSTEAKPGGDTISVVLSQVIHPRVTEGSEHEEMTEAGEADLRTAAPRPVEWSVTRAVRVIPGILSVLPPLLAIVLALLLRQVIVSLFAGVWLGALFVYDYDPIGSFFRVLDHYIIHALADPDRMSIIAFSMLFGGMVGVISRSGGTMGIAEAITRIARTPRGGQISTWVMGFMIFFDDYANTLIVGNTMRPITDRLRISREKLAFLVDSTAAPVASVLFISTWIGYEVGLIDAALRSVDMTARGAYAVFLDMLPYSFYPILTLAFGAMIALSGKDYGPMGRAEERARRHGKLYRDGAQPATDLTDSSAVVPKEGTPARWWNAAIPILTVILAALGGLWYTGMQAIIDAGGSDFSIGHVIGQADSYSALLWASLLSCLVAIVLAVGQRILRVGEAMDAWFNGLKSMLLAMLILTLAWSIGQITIELHTADYLVELLKGNLPPRLLPAATFVVAAVISFATGTSWGTMGIMMPIVIPLSVVLGQDAALSADAASVVMLGTTASVLAGAVFGDHCSPISDTTILSSMASACDHIDHVRTQLPYALTIGAVALFGGLLPAAYGISPFILLPAGVLLLAAILYWRGTHISEA